MISVIPALVWCPFPDRESARAVSSQLLEERLIRCANILGEMEAIFEWGGKIDAQSEVPVLFKTNSTMLDPMIARIGEVHPYETPAILGWHCNAAHPATLDWLVGLNPGDQT